MTSKENAIVSNSELNTKNWLNSPDTQNGQDLESLDGSSIVESSICCSSESELDNLSHTDDDETQYNEISKLSSCNDLESVEKILNIVPPPRFGDITVNNSTNVVLGNIIKIKGDLIINVKKDDKLNGEGGGQKSANELRKTQDDKENSILKTTKTVYSPACFIISRAQWLAMELDDDFRYDPIEEPVDFVVISHTATDSSTEQSTNVGIIRNMQSFHIGTQDWGDIAYNFLIGCDGNVYEGRGWGIEGTHTYGYNKKSIGIAFVGSFMCKLPTANALEACKKLMQRGIEEGHLTANFKLMGHRQCISTESPGKKLYAEIQTWKHFYDKEK